jgi:hypothetical protein
MNIHTYITYGYHGKNHKLRPCARHKHRYEYNIKKEFIEIGSEGLEWIYLASTYEH